MKWTKQPPKESGWYWRRYQSEAPCIVSVHASLPHTRFAVLFLTNSGGIEWHGFDGSHGSGPLEPAHDVLWSDEPIPMPEGVVP